MGSDIPRRAGAKGRFLCRRALGVTESGRAWHAIKPPPKRAARRLAKTQDRSAHPRDSQRLAFIVRPDARNHGQRSPDQPSADASYSDVASVRDDGAGRALGRGCVYPCGCAGRLGRPARWLGCERLVGLAEPTDGGTKLADLHCLDRCERLICRIP
jgi:hypothetical protein